jgi:hypothetical protein
MTEKLQAGESWEERTQMPPEVKLTLLVNDKLDDPRLSNALFIEIGDKQTTQDALSILKDDPALPVVLLWNGRDRMDYMSMSNVYLQTIARYPNARVRDLSKLEGIAKTFAVETPHALTFLSEESDMPSLNRIRSGLRHDLRHAIDGTSEFYKKDEIVAKARIKLGLTDADTDEEIVKKVMTEEDQSTEVVEYFPLTGMFVDWDGTVFNNGFNRTLFESLRAQAQERGIPFIIWTGGDVERIYVELNKQGITDVRVCRKQDCKGIRVSTSIDDEDANNLKRTYGLDAQEFIKIST